MCQKFTFRFFAIEKDDVGKGIVKYVETISYPSPYLLPNYDIVYDVIYNVITDVVYLVSGRWV